ncbi:hypothetical protein PR048_004274 [Dryococelus australis]|uniref:Uncharacterized protein n=1 Tax=Dryococelus australis TaxID=614101 RepID=A0ABQ9I506_9NEOP|nr:hypothetical protein PR048_004274 [Dryococelus australis]
MACLCEKTFSYRGAAVAEQLVCSPPTKAIRVQSLAGPPRIFACGNRAGRGHWSAGPLGYLPFPTLIPPWSPHSPSSALKTSLLRAVQISSLTHFIIGYLRLCRVRFGKRRPNIFVASDVIFAGVCGLSTQDNRLFHLSIPKYSVPHPSRGWPVSSSVENCKICGVNDEKRALVWPLASRSSMSENRLFTSTLQIEISFITLPTDPCHCTEFKIPCEDLLLSDFTRIHLFQIGVSYLSIFYPIRNRRSLSRFRCPTEQANRVRFPVGSSRISACRDRAGRSRCSAGFLGNLLFSPHYHSGGAPYSPRFTPIGSQDLDIKIHALISPLHLRGYLNTGVKQLATLRAPATHASKMASLASNMLDHRSPISVQQQPTCQPVGKLQQHAHPANETQGSFPELHGDRGGVVVRLLVRHLGELGSIPGGVAPLIFSCAVPDGASGRRVFSGISRLPRPCIPALLPTHLASPSSALKTQISSLNRSPPKLRVAN